MLSLHASTVNSAFQMAQTPENQCDGTLQFEDEREMNSASREATYCSALTGLASQCDNLISEIFKLRTLRKARRSMEVQCVKEVVRSHADEILAMGQTLASNGSLNVSSTTAELRVVIQSQRNQVSQLRMLLEAMRSAKTLPLPKGGTLVIGVAMDNAVSVGYTTLDSVMASVYNESRELNENSLSIALGKLFTSCGVTENCETTDCADDVYERRKR